MTICLGFHEGDADHARRLLQWIVRLGPVKGHRCVLVSDAGCPWKLALAVHQQARVAFPDGVVIIDNVKSVKGWPQGPNSLFLAAANHCRFERLHPWLWLEPDAIPIKPDWADQLEAEYGKSGTPFVGAIIDAPSPGVSAVPRYLNGVAMYPGNALEFGGFHQGPQAWDIESAERVLPQATNTPLIQCFWGEPGLPPTFVASSLEPNRMPRNAVTLGRLRPEAVLFHRNQDCSLIRLLWDKSFPATLPEEPFVTVLPIHNGDAPAQIKNTQWMGDLLNGGARRWDCVLAWQENTIGPFQMQMQQAAVRAFRTVTTCRYPNAPKSSWPAGPNWAFIHVAKFMAQLRRSWLWMESDMVPVVPDWLDQLQSAYAHCGKPIMGHIVQSKGFEHTQGTAIYPYDLLRRFPKLEAVPDGTAFDFFAKQDVAALTHDVGDLMAHCWGVVAGRIHDYLGAPPKFVTTADVESWVPKGAATFHRCKDGSLIDRLREFYQIKA